MKYKAVIFDFFGVLGTDVHIQWMKDKGFFNRVSVSEMIDKYYQYSDLGELSPSDLYKKLGELVGQPADDVETEINAYISLNNEVVNIARSLAPQCKVGLCSNAPTGYVEKILSDFGIKDIFDGSIVISSRVGCRKPDPRIFHMTMALMEVKPEDAVFIDDNQTNIEAATALGMKALLFTSHEQLVIDLKLLGVTV